VLKANVIRWHERNINPNFPPPFIIDTFIAAECLPNEGHDHGLKSFKNILKQKFTEI